MSPVAIIELLREYRREHVCHCGQHDLERVCYWCRVDMELEKWNEPAGTRFGEQNRMGAQQRSQRDAELHTEARRLTGDAVD